MRRCRSLHLGAYRVISTTGVMISPTKRKVLSPPAVGRYSARRVGLAANLKKSSSFLFLSRRCAKHYSGRPRQYIGPIRPANLSTPRDGKSKWGRDSNGSALYLNVSPIRNFPFYHIASFIFLTFLLGRAIRPITPASCGVDCEYLRLGKAWIYYDAVPDYGSCSANHYFPVKSIETFISF